MTYYADQKYKGAGKTGTSETFVDTDGDGNIDTGTLSTSFIMYAPVGNFSVFFLFFSVGRSLCPHTAHSNPTGSLFSPFFAGRKCQVFEGRTRDPNRHV